MVHMICQKRREDAESSFIAPFEKTSERSARLCGRKGRVPHWFLTRLHGIDVGRSAGARINRHRATTKGYVQFAICLMTSQMRIKKSNSKMAGNVAVQNVGHSFAASRRADEGNEERRWNGGREGDLTHH